MKRYRSWIPLGASHTPWHGWKPLGGARASWHILLALCARSSLVELPVFFEG